MTLSKEFDGATVLVVGGAGFVGSNLCHHLLTSDLKTLVIVDNFLSAEKVNLPEDARVQLIEGSIADDFVLRQLPSGIDYAWHLACYHGNQSSIADPIADHDNNTITSLKLFQLLSNRDSLKKVVYAAAGCAVAEKTHGDPIETPEDAPVSLFHDSPYSISKLVGEMYGNYFFNRYNMPFVKARFQNVYGPREILGAGRWRGTPTTVWRNVTPTFIWKSMHGEALPLENAGQTGRDFIYVDDICRGLIACALAGKPGETYNLATGREILIRDWAATINAITGNPTSVELKPARPWDNSGRRYGSIRKSREELEFEVHMTPAIGLRSTVEWTRLNRETIAATIHRHSSNLSRFESECI
jgi:nucleoside-diphosphate-sugar epimerase